MVKKLFLVFCAFVVVSSFAAEKESKKELETQSSQHNDGATDERESFEALISMRKPAMPVTKAAKSKTLSTLTKFDTIPPLTDSNLPGTYWAGNKDRYLLNIGVFDYNVFKARQKIWAIAEAVIKRSIQENHKELARRKNYLRYGGYYTTQGLIFKCHKEDKKIISGQLLSPWGSSALFGSALFDPLKTEDAKAFLTILNNNGIKLEKEMDDFSVVSVDDIMLPKAIIELSIGGLDVYGKISAEKELSEFYEKEQSLMASKAASHEKSALPDEKKSESVDVWHV